MQKYYLHFKTYWSYILSYRTSWLLWRFRQFILSFMALSLWTAVYAQSETVFGYDKSQLFTYIFITAILQNIILSTSLNNLGNMIYSGELSNILVKPIKTLGFFVSRDAADKSFNTLSTCVEMLVLWVIFKPDLTLPSVTAIPFLLMSIIFGIIISFSVQLLFGSIGFWSPDTWGPRFLFYILVDLTSGKLFPLDILPTSVQQLLFLTPFPYFTYAQVQLALDRTIMINYQQAILGIGLWSIALPLSALYIWKKGMDQYQAAGQ